MAGFLNIDRLRTLEAAGDRWTEIVRSLRPRLVAEWHVAPDGRLVCRWVNETAEPVA